MKALKLILLICCAVLLASCSSLKEKKVIRLLDEISADISATAYDAAWEKAQKAEDVARKHSFGKELAAALVSKAKLCFYDEASSDVERVDEGLGYAQEAFQLAEENNAAEEQCEACYALCSLYINNNRWPGAIDPASYRIAGEWLEKGQTLADSYNIPRLRREGIKLRALWYQRGNLNNAAENYLEQALREADNSDPLMISTVQDCLLNLYIRSGQYKKAFETYKDYVAASQAGIQQTKEDMQASWHRASIIYKVIIVFLLLAVATLAILLIRTRKSTRS